MIRSFPALLLHRFKKYFIFRRRTKLCRQYAPVYHSVRKYTCAYVMMFIVSNIHRSFVFANVPAGARTYLTPMMFLCTDSAYDAFDKLYQGISPHASLPSPSSGFEVRAMVDGAWTASRKPFAKSQRLCRIFMPALAEGRKIADRAASDSQHLIDAFSPPSRARADLVPYGSTRATGSAASFAEVV